MHHVDRPAPSGPLAPTPWRDPDLPRPPSLPAARDWPHTDTLGLGRPALADPARRGAATRAPYVDVTTGDLVLHDVDVALPGTLPLLLTRTHRSSWTGPSWFGVRWCSVLDERLEIDGDDVTWVRADATRVQLRLPTPQRPTRTTGGPLVGLRLSATGALVLLDPARAVERHFLAGGPVRPLDAVVDRLGHRTSIVRDATGVPTEVRHTGGYRVLVEVLAGRVTSLRVAGPQRPGPDERWAGGGVDGPPGTEVRRFTHDEHGHLAGVVVPVDDALELRAGLHTDATGRLVGLSGDVEGGAAVVHHDEAGLCTGIEAATTTRFSYASDDDGLRCTRTDDTTWSLDERARPTRVGDVELGWDDRDRLAVRSDADGTRTWVHDDSNRVVAELGPADADGTRAEWRWAHLEPLGDEPVGVRRPDGGTWRQELDPLGRARVTTDPEGRRTTREAAGTGRVVEVAGPDDGVLRSTCDGAGLPVAEDRADGTRWRWRRDDHGRVVEVVDGSGEQWRATWGPLGATSCTPPGRGTTTRTWRRGGSGAVEPVVVDPDGHETGWAEEPPTRAHGHGHTGDLDVEWHLGAAGHPHRAEVSADGEVVAVLDLEHDPCGRVIRLALVDGASVEVLRDPDGLPASQSVVPPPAQVALQGMALLEARLSGAAPPASTRSDAALERRWAWSPAGRPVSVTQDAQARRPTPAPSDGRVGQLLLDGVAVLRVHVGTDGVDLRLALVGPDSRAWAVVSGSGEPLWVADPGADDATVRAGWDSAWGAST